MSLRLRSILVIATVGTLALAGLTGCGLRNTSGTAAASDTADGTSVEAEAVALTALGIPAADLDAPAGPSASPDKRGRHPRRPWLRRGLSRNVEHGEVVVDTKDGTKTIDVQRGTITAINSTTLTVKSKDGFTLTWTLGSDKLRVIEHRST